MPQSPMLLDDDVVSDRQAKSGALLFPYVDKTGRPGHRKRIDASWIRIREAAGLSVGGPDGFRGHDLRHTFATTAIENGAALPTVAKLLGSVRTTMRYAHATPAMMSDAAENVAAAIRRSTNGGK